MIKDKELNAKINTCGGSNELNSFSKILLTSVSQESIFIRQSFCLVVAVFINAPQPLISWPLVSFKVTHLMRMDSDMEGLLTMQSINSSSVVICSQHFIQLISLGINQRKPRKYRSAVLYCISNHGTADELISSVLSPGDSTYSYLLPTSYLVSCMQSFTFPYAVYCAVNIRCHTSHFRDYSIVHLSRKYNVGYQTKARQSNATQSKATGGLITPFLQQYWISLLQLNNYQFFLTRCINKLLH